MSKAAPSISCYRFRRESLDDCRALRRGGRAQAQRPSWPRRRRCVAARKANGDDSDRYPALADPVALAWVASIARPRGNVTGIMPYVDGLPAKPIGAAREIVPGAGGRHPRNEI